ncbi:MAG TPA: hypothetical protein VOA87_06355 [Thermoanaerobaculia bacterium]|nr:hypothetical protein [Thermoanaerobaculia bacterium]
MPDWMVNIVAGAKPGDPATFVPQLQPPRADGALIAQANDNVNWNNTTKDTHQPWPAEANFTPLPDADVPRNSPNYLSDSIAPGASSRPPWGAAKSTVTGTTVYYICKKHPQERGMVLIAT